MNANATFMGLLLRYQQVRFCCMKKGWGEDGFIFFHPDSLINVQYQWSPTYVHYFSAKNTSRTLYTVNVG